MDSILFSSSEKLVSGSQLGLRSNSFLDKWFKNYIVHIIESHFSVSSATHDFCCICFAVVSRVQQLLPRNRYCLVPGKETQLS